jgi:hypothetical protein
MGELHHEGSSVQVVHGSLFVAMLPAWGRREENRTEQKRRERKEKEERKEKRRKENGKNPNLKIYGEKIKDNLWSWFKHLSL